MYMYVLLTGRDDFNTNCAISYLLWFAVITRSEFIEPFMDDTLPLTSQCFGRNVIILFMC